MTSPQDSPQGARKRKSPDYSPAELAPDNKKARLDTTEGGDGDEENAGSGAVVKEDDNGNDPNPAAYDEGESSYNAGHPRKTGKKSKRVVDGQPLPDPTTGQRSFLPGLDDGAEGSDEDPETIDALAYLRSVR
jgi:hypothetical protein